MTGHDQKQINIGVLLAVVWVAVAIQLLLQNWHSLAVTLGDSDDAMRLVQVRAFLDGRGWFDLHEPRLSPPIGFDTHWSRLVDAGLAALFVIFHQFGSAAWAEELMRAVWPLLWLLPAMAAVVAISWRLAGREATLASLVLLALGLPALQQFRPGRIDHHNVQIALSLLILAAAVWADRKPRATAAAGALSGLAMAVGLESAPLVALAGLIFAANYVFGRVPARTVATYGFTAAASSMVFFLIGTSPALILRPVCDEIAINFVALVAIAGIGLACAALYFPRPEATARCAVVAAIGVAAVLVALALDPQCVRGPFAAIEPAVWPIWHSHVREMQSLVAISRQSPVVGIAIAAYPVAALVALAALARDREMRRSLAFLGIAAALLCTVAMTMAAIRSEPYAIWLCIPIIAAAAPRLSERLRLRSLAGRTIVTLLLTPAVVSATAVVLAEAAGEPPVAERDNAACFQSASYAPIAALPAGLIAADVDYGSFVLALTPHAALAAPYHRLSSAIIADHRIFASPPDRARQLLEAGGVSYVLMCGDRPPAGLSEFERRNSLWSSLHAGIIPGWLEPIAASGAIVAYRVQAIVAGFISRRPVPEPRH